MKIDPTRHEKNEKRKKVKYWVCPISSSGEFPEEKGKMR